VSQEPTLRQRALRFLARREYSRKELHSRLARHAATEEELEQLLDALASRGQLSDQRYAEARMHTMSRKYGASRILHELQSKGVDADIAERTAATARETDVERAKATWKRKFKTAPSSREERARHARFLQSRGFSFDTIKLVLSSTAGEAEDA
jgi:regulatory protein